MFRSDILFTFSTFSFQLGHPSVNRW